MFSTGKPVFSLCILVYHTLRTALFFHFQHLTVPVTNSQALPLYYETLSVVQVSKFIVLSLLLTLAGPCNSRIL